MTLRILNCVMQWIIDRMVFSMIFYSYMVGGKGSLADRYKLYRIGKLCYIDEIWRVKLVDAMRKMSQEDNDPETKEEGLKIAAAIEKQGETALRRDMQLPDTHMLIDIFKI